MKERDKNLNEMVNAGMDQGELQERIRRYD